MIRLAKMVARCERGATAVEYAVLVAVLAFGVTFVAFGIAKDVWTKLNSLTALSA